MKKNNLDLSNLVLYKILAVNTINKTNNQVVIRKGRFTYALALKIEGSTIYKCNNKEYISDCHTLLIISKNTNYTWYCEKLGKCIMIEFDADFDNQLFDFYPIQLNIQNEQEIAKLFTIMANIWNSKKKNYILKCKSLFYEIISKAMTNFEDIYVPKYMIKSIEPAMKYMLSNYDDIDISNESLAKLCGISVVYFRKLFYKIYKVAPFKYLKKIRLDKAKELLIGDFSSISDIATLVGFSSVYTFSKTFKKEIGVAPTEYAKTINLEKVKSSTN